MPGNYPNEYSNKFEPEENEYTPWPPDTNDKPFMTYESLMKGAPGKPAKQCHLGNIRHTEDLTLFRLKTDLSLDSIRTEQSEQSQESTENMAKKKSDSRLTRAGVSGFNKPKRTPSHPTKSHVVVAKEGSQVKTIRFGQQGVSGDKKPTARQKSFKARHSKNIAKGKMSAAFWADKVKW